MNSEQLIKIEEFVHEVRMHRAKPFVTQLAAHVGVTPQTIYNWEKESHSVSRALSDLGVLRELRRGTPVTETKGDESSPPLEPLGLGRSAAEGEGENSLDALTDADLAAHAEPWFRRLRMQMGQAHQLAEQHGNLAALPFLVYRMEQTMGQMQQVMTQLRQLRDEWQRRYEPGAPPPPQEELFSAG